MIITTAGHIDHGKTALVKALTGTDTDRLPEERARGITVDLGFAYRRLGNGAAMGFVDVPGHERLVRTMMAGASGVDLALLVVAADDGVMPQTREHVAILDLLGVRRAVVAITKADRVANARIAQVAGDVAALLAGTALAGASTLQCNSLRGDGVPAIAAALEQEAAAIAARCTQGRFRLAVDRCFVLPGVGLVAAGFIHAGTVRPGDRVLVSPAGHELRVRGIQAHDEPAGMAHAGQRVALNLAGTRADRDSIGRGDWIIDPALHQPTQRLAVQLRLLPSEARPLKHWTPVHLHLGTASIAARVSLQLAVPPGEIAQVQLVLDSPFAALCGDRFALRDASSQRTIGGGRVIDPFASPRRPGDRVAALAAWALEDDADAFAALLNAVPGGIELAAFRQARNLASTEITTAACIHVGSLGLAPTHWAALKADLVAALQAQHDGQPDDLGATAEQLAAAFPKRTRPIVPAALGSLIESGDIVRTGRLLHRPGREIRLSPADAALWEAVQASLAQAALDPPRLTMLAERLGSDVPGLRGSGSV